MSKGREREIHKLAKEGLQGQEKVVKLKVNGGGQFGKEKDKGNAI